MRVTTLTAALMLTVSLQCRLTRMNSVWRSPRLLVAPTLVLVAGWTATRDMTGSGWTARRKQEVRNARRPGYLVLGGRMQKAAILDELAFASSSMEGACRSRSDEWAKAEQALLDAQERSARLMRELGLQREAMRGHRLTSLVSVSVSQARGFTSLSLSAGLKA